MSSQQQQSNNSNNNSVQYPANLPAAAFDDYEEYTPIYPYNNPQLLMQNGVYYDPNSQSYFANPPYNPDTNADDDIPLDFENDFIDSIEGSTNEQLNENDEDETLYSDTVQNAFASYENQYAKYWNQNESKSNDIFPEDEEMFQEMQECWQYLTEEQERDANFFSNDAESLALSTLNPDAVEFRPSWSTSTDKEANVMTSSTPSETKKEKEQ